MARGKRIFGVLDFETDPFRHGRADIKPFAGEIYCGPNSPHNYVAWGDRAADKVAMVLKEMPPARIYAHNGGKFDFHFLLRHVNLARDVKIIRGRIAVIWIGEVALIDSYLLLPIPLAEYRKTEIDYELFERDVRNKHRAEILDYLHDDCCDLFELVSGVQAYTGRALTIGSAAFADMKAKGIEIEKQDELHDNRFRPFFFGGRCQTRKIGELARPATVYDINSAYPYAMLHQHPHGRRYTISQKLPRSTAAIQRSFIRVKCESRGAFPFREKNGSLGFPDDGARRLFRVTGWEYLAARDTGVLRSADVLEVLTADKTITFGRFILPHYLARKAAKKRENKIDDIYHKLIMNSGYGKFALDPRDFCEYVLAEIGDATPQEAGYRYETDATAELALWARDSFDGDGFYDVATAASVTGFVRAMLWRAICAVGPARVLYCDTDSLFVDGTSKKLDIGGDLGQWKVEGRAESGAICAKKLYALRGEFGDEREKIACKGVDLTYKQILMIARGKTVKWRSKAPNFGIGRDMAYVKREIDLNGKRRKKREKREA